jgi:hypothetical protein
MAISSEGMSQEEYENLNMFPSWKLIDGIWTPPIPKPNDGMLYNWDEENKNWSLAKVQDIVKIQELLNYIDAD